MEQRQECPVCRKMFKTGNCFREYMLGEHSPSKNRLGKRSTVVCESCWKPMPYYCILYHVWHHKNQAEQAELLASGGKIDPKIKIKLGLAKKRRNRWWEIKSETEEDSEDVSSPESGVPKSSQNNFPTRLKREPKVPKKNRVIGCLKKRKLRVVKPGWKRGEGEVNFINVFYAITDTLLLFKTTVVQYSPLGFTCLGPDSSCGHFVSGSDYFTFQNMRTHVNESHGGDHPKECPLCHKNVETGNSFRSFRDHMLGEHSPNKNRLGTKSSVVCESCWKPMPYYCILYHVWHHKNQAEQAALLASGGKIDAKIKIRLGLAKKPREREIAELEARGGLEEISSSPPYDEPKPEISKPKKSLSNNFKDGPFFFSLGEGHLYHRGVIIQHSSTVFLCTEPKCGLRVGGSDHSTFTQFQQHAEEQHGELLNSEDDTVRTCPKCGKSFTGIMSFRRHVFFFHAPPAVCPRCWKEVTSYLGLGKHIWLHMSEEEKAAVEAAGHDGKFYPKRESEVGHFCKVCSRHYSSEGTLRTHQKLHQAVRPIFTCPEPGCTFSALNKVSLVGHTEREHTPAHLLQKKMIKCPICAQQFYRRYGSAFRAHVRSHTGETPFVCDKCGRRFTCKKILRNHLNAFHATSRPFQCEFCEKTYKLSYVLKLHQRHAHPSLVAPTDPEMKRKCTTTMYREGFIGPKIAFPCELCGKIFDFRSRLKTHTRSAHPDVVI